MVHILLGQFMFLVFLFDKEKIIGKDTYFRNLNLFV
jgi:hypothetical protein